MTAVVSLASERRRKTWAGMLAKGISPNGSGTTLEAIHAALAALADLSDAAFSPACARAIAPRCSANPGPEELRDQMLGWLNGTSKPAPISGYPYRAPVPDWLLLKILEGCAGEPGPMLRNWLASKDIDDSQYSFKTRLADLREAAR